MTKWKTWSNTPSLQSGYIKSSENGLVKIVSSSIPYATPENPDFVWDYTEDSISYNYEVQITHDPDETKNQERTIVVDFDPYNNGSAAPLMISSAPQSAVFLKSAVISADKQSVTYVVDNTKLPGTNGTITFTLKPSNLLNTESNDTRYYNANGTIASNIGLMLLEKPNGKLGMSVTEVGNEQSNVSIDHPIRRDNHDDSDFVKSIKVVDRLLNETEYTTNDLYLGSDGYLYFRNDDGTLLVDDDAYAIEVMLASDDHSPVGDYSFRMPLPQYFAFHNHVGENPDSVVDFAVSASNGKISKVDNTSHQISSYPYAINENIIQDSTFSMNRQGSSGEYETYLGEALTGIKVLEGIL